VNEFYTTSEVAQVLRVGRKAVVEMIKRKEIKGIQVGQKYRVSAVEFERIQNSGTKAAS
jgi:excisionase family DNA binding protein